MGSRKIIDGRENGKFDGGESITRAELAAIVVRKLGLPSKGTSAFSDVPATSWYSRAVATASEYGIISGYGDNRFAPMSNITREEAMAMIERAAKLTEISTTETPDKIASELSKFADGSKASNWAKEAATVNMSNGLIAGNNGFCRPSDSITRAETAVVVLRMLQKTALIDIRTKA